MVYLILAIVSSAVISLLMRAGEKHVQNNMTMFIYNYIICMLMAIMFKGNTSLPENQEGILFLPILCAMCLIRWEMQHGRMII